MLSIVYSLILQREALLYQKMSVTFVRYVRPLNRYVRYVVENEVGKVLAVDSQDSRRRTFYPF
jgi:hypothetical protein